MFNEKQQKAILSFLDQFPFSYVDEDAGLVFVKNGSTSSVGVNVFSLHDLKCVGFFQQDGACDHERDFEEICKGWLLGEELESGALGEMLRDFCDNRDWYSLLYEMQERWEEGQGALRDWLRDTWEAHFSEWKGQEWAWETPKGVIAAMPTGVDLDLLLAFQQEEEWAVLFEKDGDIWLESSDDREDLAATVCAKYIISPFEEEEG